MQPRTRHPYVDQPDRAYWRKTVTNRHPLDIADWYHKKFSLDGARIAAAGSCFAQHIGRYLRSSGFDYLDTEPAPALLAPERHRQFGYGMYSARFGNVYTSRQLLQLFQRAFGLFQPEEDHWVKDDGVVDPFRPTIEPRPFADVDELQADREHHLAQVRRMFEGCDVFVFTLGLTEAWASRADGAVFPLAPGTAGGTWDPDRYHLQNLTYPMVMADMSEFLRLFREVRPEGRLMLTVSPVPLVATASEEQVVVATTYSKSVLRAVAGVLTQQHEYVDYFPSYEIVSSPVMRSQFFQPDMREVSPHGVAHVMRQFFAAHPPPTTVGGPPVATDPSVADEDIECDQVLLEAFGE